MLREQVVNEADQTSGARQSEVPQIQTGVVFTQEQIRKIFEGYAGGACGFADED